jgi:hypothetical protein
MPASALRSFDRCSAVCSGWPVLGGQGKCFRGAGAAAAAFVATAVIGYQAVRPGPLAHADRAAFAVVRARRRPAGVVAARAVCAHWRCGVPPDRLLAGGRPAAGHLERRGRAAARFPCYWPIEASVDGLACRTRRLQPAVEAHNRSRAGRRGVRPDLQYPLPRVPRVNGGCPAGGRKPRVPGCPLAERRAGRLVVRGRLAAAYRSWVIRPVATGCRTWRLASCAPTNPETEDGR